MARVFVTPEWIASVETKPWRSRTGEERLYINDWQHLVGLRMELDADGKWQKAFFGSDQITRSEYRKVTAAKAFVVGNLLTVEGSTSMHITDGMLAAQMQAAVARSAPIHALNGTPVNGARLALYDDRREHSWALADAMFEQRADVDPGALLARLRARMDAVEAQFTGDAIGYHTSEAIWKAITAPATDLLPWNRDNDPGGPESWDLRASEDLVDAETLLDCEDLIRRGIQVSSDAAALTAVMTAVEHLVRPTDGSRPVPATRRSVLDWLDANALSLDDPATQRWWPGQAREWMTRSGGLPPESVPTSEASYVDELEWLAVAAREVPRARDTRIVLGLLTGDDGLAETALPVPVEWAAAMGGELPRFRPEPLPTQRVRIPAYGAETPLLLSAGWTVQTKPTVAESAVNWSPPTAARPMQAATPATDSIGVHL